MLATNFEIINKRRSNPVGATDIKDFELRENGQIDAQEILTNARITLYALDFESGQAVFLESALPEELSQAPFYAAEYARYVQDVIGRMYTSALQNVRANCLGSQRTQLGDRAW